LSEPAADAAAAPVAAAPAPHSVAATRPDDRSALALALIFLAALFACLLAYLAMATPGRWFPGVSTISIPARDLAVSNGRGVMRGDELFVVAPDTDGVATIVARTDFRALDYPAIAWIVIDLPDDADVRVIWRSDYAPQRLQGVPVRVESGRLRPLLLADDPNWLGKVTGLGLAIRAPLAQPVRIRGVLVKPMGVLDLAVDRWREWTAAEGWTGISINSVTGGADVQDLPLPILLFAALVVAGAVVLLLARLRPGLVARPVLAIGVLALAAWFALDLRWTVNLARQAAATGEQYAGKDWRAKHLAADDGDLFEFIEKVRAAMPTEPQRVFVLSDAHYFRGRAAFHLFPHNVWWDPWKNTVPPADQLKPGDWIVVYQRRGVGYDRAQQMLRWDGAVTVPAEIKAVDSGAALFRVRGS
jgi:hypothetical protein